MNNFIRKHIQTIGLVGLTLISAVSCRRANSTRIFSDDGTNSQTIQYAGRIIFNPEQTEIESISKGGFLKYERNDNEMEAEPDNNGKVTYEFDGGSKITTLTTSQKQVVAEVIRAVIKARAKLHHR